MIRTVWREGSETVTSYLSICLLHWFDCRLSGNGPLLGACIFCHWSGTKMVRFVNAGSVRLADKARVQPDGPIRLQHRRPAMRRTGWGRPYIDWIRSVRCILLFRSATIWLRQCGQHAFSSLWSRSIFSLNRRGYRLYAGQAVSVSHTASLLAEVIASVASARGIRDILP